MRGAYKFAVEKAQCLSLCDVWRLMLVRRKMSNVRELGDGESQDIDRGAKQKPAR